MDLHPIQGWGRGGGGRNVEIFLVTLCNKNWNKLQPNGSLDLYADYI